MIVDEYHKKFNAGHPKYENIITMLRTIFFFGHEKGGSRMFVKMSRIPASEGGTPTSYLDC